MKVAGKRHIATPLATRKRHGLLPRRNGEKMTRGQRALATMLRGGKIKGTTEDWLQLTRGET